MKKILVFGLTDNFGGIETFFYTYYKKLDKNKYGFDFITVSDTIAFSEEYKKNNSNIYKVENFKKNPLKYIKQIKRIINMNEYDIVHINMLSAANILPVIICNKSKMKKIIVHSHNNNVPKGIFRQILNLVNRKFLTNQKYIKLACSRSAGEWMFNKNSNFIVLNNAIDVNKFKFNNVDRLNIREEYKIKEDEFLLGNVGRLCEQKNQIFLTNLMNIIDDKKIKLMLIGNGPMKEELLYQIKKYKLENQIIMIDNKPDINRYYSAFDLFVFPSIFEGLGIVAIEAQASSLDCLFSENILKEVDINNNKYISLKDIEQWKQQIYNYKNSNSKERKVNYEKLKNNGFDIENEYKKLENIYDS